MRPTNRILFAIFILLLVITLAEGGYYLFYQYNKTVNVQSSINNNPIDSSSSGYNKDIDILLGNITPQTKYYILSQLAAATNSAMISGFSKVDYQCSILNLDSKGGTLANGQINYAIKIICQNDKTAKPLTLFYRSAELPVIKFFKTIGNKPVSATAQEFKTGDPINVEEIFDLKQDRTSSVTITKL